MKNIKTFLLSTAFLWASSFAHADGFSFGWGYSDRGQVTCKASDAGWEEHWGGHDSCGECLSRHGKCEETCSQQFYSCVVEGKTGRGHVERTIEFQATGSTRWDAEDRARDRCWRSHATGCRLVTCDSESEVISRKGC